MPHAEGISADSPFAIKRLGPGDAEHARSMNALFGNVFDDAESYASSPPDDSYLSGLLASQRNIALLALAAGKAIGALTAYTLQKFEQARSEIYIYDLAVAESWRRRGVATALIEETKQIAHSVGAWAVFVQADYDDDPAIALYTKLGSREDVMHFDLLP